METTFLPPACFSPVIACLIGTAIGIAFDTHSTDCLACVLHMMVVVDAHATDMYSNLWGVRGVMRDRVVWLSAENKLFSVELLECLLTEYPLFFMQVENRIMPLLLRPASTATGNGPSLLQCVETCFKRLKYEGDTETDEYLRRFMRTWGNNHLGPLLPPSSIKRMVREGDEEEIARLLKGLQFKWNSFEDVLDIGLMLKEKKVSPAIWREYLLVVDWNRDCDDSIRHKVFEQCILLLLDQESKETLHYVVCVAGGLSHQVPSALQYISDSSSSIEVAWLLNALLRMFPEGKQLRSLYEQMNKKLLQMLKNREAGEVQTILRDCQLWMARESHYQLDSYDDAFFLYTYEMNA